MTVESAMSTMTRDWLCLQSSWAICNAFEYSYVCHILFYCFGAYTLTSSSIVIEMIRICPSWPLPKDQYCKNACTTVEKQQVRIMCWQISKRQPVLSTVVQSYTGNFVRGTQYHGWMLQRLECFLLESPPLAQPLKHFKTSMPLIHVPDNHPHTCSSTLKPTSYYKGHCLHPHHHGLHMWWEYCNDCKRKKNFFWPRLRKHMLYWNKFGQRENRNKPTLHRNELCPLTSEAMHGYRNHSDFTTS